MKNPSLSRRIYNNSLTLALSFSFYALIFLCTLSCEGEEAVSVSDGDVSEEAHPLEIGADSVESTPPDAVSYVEQLIK